MYHRACEVAVNIFLTRKGFYPIDIGPLVKFLSGVMEWYPANFQIILEEQIVLDREKNLVWSNI